MKKNSLQPADGPTKELFADGMVSGGANTGATQNVAAAKVSGCVSVRETLFREIAVFGS